LDENALYERATSDMKAKRKKSDFNFYGDMEAFIKS
jgi:hypothetical protein